MNDVEEHNQWVQDLIDDVEWEPLKEFLERLKEPEPIPEAVSNPPAVRG